MELEQPTSVDSTAADAAAADTAANPHVDTAQAGDAGPVDETAELLALLPQDDGMEEIEHEGVKAKVPKELKEAFMRNADYTRKTQEVAEQRRNIEAQQAALQQQARFQQENVAEVAVVAAIDMQLAEFNKLDWSALIAQNPQQAALLDRQMRDLQGKRTQITHSLSQKQQHQALREQQETAKRIQEGRRELEREIKGWSPETAEKLGQYGLKSGFPEALLQNMGALPFAVPLLKALHKAQQYDQLLAQRTTKPQSAPPPPATRVGARASAAVTDPDKLNADDWMKWRGTQLAAKQKKR